MLDHRYYGLDPVGCLEHYSLRRATPCRQEMGRLIRQHCIRDVVVAFGGNKGPDLVEILQICDRLDVEV
jgi:hypothetical protein